MSINYGYTSFFAACSIIYTIHNSLRSLNNSAFRSSAVVDKCKKGENVLYTDDQGTQVSVHFSKCTLFDEVLKYVVVDKGEIDISTYKQHLKQPSQLDKSAIPIKPADYEKNLSHWEEEELKRNISSRTYESNGSTLVKLSQWNNETLSKICDDKINRNGNSTKRTFAL